MSFVGRPFVWFYYAFGVSAIHATGRNAYLIIIARTCRTFAYGTNSLILALFFAELGFSDYKIGLFMTLTLVGDVVLGTLLTLIADRVGRRKILIAGSGLMVLTGVIFAWFENFWMLLFAAIIGVVSATGGDFGPFRSIEESILSHLTTPETRADVLAWYVTISALGSAIGSELSGRIVHFLEELPGWGLLSAYHALFWMYALMGLVNAGLTFLLTDACEIRDVGSQAYARVAQDEEDDIGTQSTARSRQNAFPNGHGATMGDKISTGRVKRSFTWISRNLSQISGPTRRTVWKLWLLLGLDSVADGMVPYTLTNYYMDEKFHPSKSSLGDANSVAYLLGSIGNVFAGPLARKIGLINTMVFTHIPSSASVLLFPLPNTLWMTIGLLFVRAGLNSMDQAPRSAFIAAIVRPEERTAVMGITATVRTLAATLGPSFTGVLAGSNRFWIAFVAAGICRLVYDVGLWLLFVNAPLHKYEGGDSSARPVHDENQFALDASSDEEDEALEMQEIGTTDPRKSGGTDLDRVISHDSTKSLSLAPAGAQQARRRSPSPFANAASRK